MLGVPPYVRHHRTDSNQRRRASDLQVPVIVGVMPYGGSLMLSTR